MHEAPTTSTPRQPLALGPVAETLMIPLWCRAMESRRRRPILHDAKAIEIVDALDYDFEGRLAHAKRLAFRACLRTAMIDRWVLEFVRRHPEGVTVVEVGTGLNTRFERVDDGRLRWFDVDLPDSLALRRRFFVDTPRRTMVEGAFGDSAWLRGLAGADRAMLFVVEAVLVYLDEAQVRRGLAAIAEAYPGAQIIFDTVRTSAIAKLERPMMRSYDAPFVWGCDDPRTIEAWGRHRWLESSTMAELPRELLRRVPLEHRLALPWLRLRRPELLRAHALHRFALQPGEPVDRPHG